MRTLCKLNKDDDTDVKYCLIYPLTVVLLKKFLQLMNFNIFYSFQSQKHKLHQTEIQKEAGFIWRELCSHLLPELNNGRELHASQWTTCWLWVQTKSVPGLGRLARSQQCILAAPVWKLSIQLFVLTLKVNCCFAWVVTYLHSLPFIHKWIISFTASHLTWKKWEMDIYFHYRTVQHVWICQYNEIN